MRGGFRVLPHKASRKVGFFDSKGAILAAPPLFFMCAVKESKPYPKCRWSRIGSEFRLPDSRPRKRHLYGCMTLKSATCYVMCMDRIAPNKSGLVGQVFGADKKCSSWLAI
jgi:hypothetical protein